MIFRAIQEWKLPSLSAMSLILLVSSCQTWQIAQPPVEDNKAKLLETKLSLATQQLELQNTELALETLRLLEKEYPQEAKVLNLLGLAHLTLGNNDRALVLLKQAYRLSPEIFIGLNLSSAMIATGKFPEARKLLNKLVKNKEYNYRERLYHNYALSFEKEKKIDRAILYYQKALSENPVYSMSLLNLGKIWKDQNKRELAKETLQKASQYCGVCYAPLNELAYMYIEDGETAKAIQLLDHYLQRQDIAKEDRSSGSNLYKLASRLKK